MHRLGKVQDWNDDRGYGFIVPLDSCKGDDRAFFHIRDYQQQGRRPQSGELVKYLASRQDDGRWKATQVVRAVQVARAAKAMASAQARPGNPYSAGRDLVRIAMVLGYVFLLGAAVRAQQLPLEFAFVPAIMSIVTFMAYAADKHAAQTG
ncbi:MAG: cold shock domain-containing protein, partial [Pseudoxanthomonas sp.]